MQKTSLPWLISSLFICFSTMLHAYNVSFQVLEPQDKSIHVQDRVSYVVRVDIHSVDTIKILTDKNERFTIDVTPGRDTYCQSIPVHAGRNKIRVRGYSKDKKIGEEFLELYYFVPLSKIDKFPPKEYAKKFFHTEQEEMLCKRCHDMSVNEVENTAFEDVAESNCYLCHKSITNKQYTHAPAVNWICTGCHSGKSAERNSKDEGKSRFLAPDPIGSVCKDCHKKTKNKWVDKRYQHNPAALGRCTRCHDPHASENRFTLREPVWELCRTCHGAKANKQAFVTEISKQPDHPLNPSNSGKELDCASCHNPHVSDRGFFLQPNYSGDMTMCKKLNNR